MERRRRAWVCKARRQLQPTSHAAWSQPRDAKKFAASYFNFADSDLAAIRMGRPGSASFQQREEIVVGGARLGAAKECRRCWLVARRISPPATVSRFEGEELPTAAGTFGGFA